ncbi:MAG: putative ABC transporter ATP-binding protein [Lentisphaerae bacterium ADurb.BinA184]|nr:MAG: putative ABC transporter ATP-binding protein [Lentisphaerae bacterium ADurb.BinA184]
MTAAAEQRPTLAGFFRPYVGNLVALMALTVVLSVLAMLPPLLVREVIDGVVTEGRHDLLTALTVAMIAVHVATAACQYVQTRGIAYLGQRFVFDIRVTLFNHLLGLSLRFFGKNSAGKLVNRLMGDSGTVQQVITGQTITLVSDLACASFAICATFLLNWRMALLLLLAVAGFVINYRLTIRRITRATRGYSTAMDRLSGGIQNRLLASVAVKSFGTEGREQETFQAASLSSLALSTEAAVASTRFSMNSHLLQQVGRSVLYFAGCAFVLRDEMTYGDVVAFTSYAFQLLGPAVRFTEVVRMVQDVRIAVERLFELFRQRPEITPRPGAVRPPRFAGDVSFQAVVFEYEPGTPVIRNFSLDVRRGQRVALIGPTGCGKSTLLNLLMRFYDVGDGAIRIDGHDVRDLELDALRRQFGIVLQEPLLFDVSVAENIRYGRADATRAEIEAAAKAAEIHDFISRLPQGYDTVLGSEGVDMSVGQRQRITIARAIAADPAILIMDEATSALDSESEAAIQRAMERMLKGRTSFIVAHRLSTIRGADIIVLLEHGQIREMGRHDELMALPNGGYRELYEKFMGKGVIGGEA